MLLPILLRSRALPLRRAITASGLFSQRFKHKVPRICDAHMNELPIPCIPWDVYWKEKQSYYSKVLAAGALWFLFSYGMLFYTDSFHLNCSPPARPGPPSEMVEECED